MLRFAAMLERELARKGVDVEIVRPQPLLGHIRPGGTGAGKWLGYIDKFVAFPPELKRAVAGMNRKTVVHICDHSNAFYTRYLSAVPHLVTCNDLIAIRAAHGDFPNIRVGPTGRMLQRWIRAGLLGARRITCISQSTLADLKRFVGENAPADVTLMGLNYPYTPLSHSEAAARVKSILGDGERYILHVGGNQWYKNRTGVLSIYEALGDMPQKPKLVMAGPPFDQTMKAFLRKHPSLKSQVISVNGAGDEMLRALYSAAELLLFPSIEEGFGWPVIEAQACGCRVAATGKAPLTEAGGEAMFRLPEPPSMAEAGAFAQWSRDSAAVVRGILAQDEASRAQAHVAGLANARHFSAETMAQRYVEIYEELIYKGTQ